MLHGLPFAIRSTPPDMVSDSIAFFDQIMDETAEDRFDIAFSDRRKRQWHMPIRMGGAAAPAYLANTVDCCDLVREMLGKDDIVTPVPWKPGTISKKPPTQRSTSPPTLKNSSNNSNSLETTRAATI